MSADFSDERRFLSICVHLRILRINPAGFLLALALAVFHNLPVLDIKLIREKPDFVCQRLATRGAGDEALVEKILHIDEQRRKILVEVEALKSQRNRASKEIGALMGQKKLEEAEAKKKEMRDLGDRIATLDQQAAETESARNSLMLQMPNLPHESVPAGSGAAENPVVRVHGDKAAFAFKPKTHVELCENLIGE